MVVTGDSMQPAFRPGDRLLVAGPWPPRPGQVVAVRDPRVPERLLVKRVHHVESGGLDVRGDNPPASTDSRHFGPVPRELLVGRVVHRYAPLHRRAWMP
ncbi:MAG: nickel-type superoxide dismutase maturation protease [Acidimicrobiales bacterium]|nr:nickel-type superoxide dismutase maturation protease [Acidimicrobiales bacterium]